MEIRQSFTQLWEREREREREGERERETDSMSQQLQHQHMWAFPKLSSYLGLNWTRSRHSSCLKPVLNWAHVCSANILRTVRRTMICFLTELLVHWTWFGQFDKLYFILNWLVMRCKLRPELVADAQQTAWSKMLAKVKSIYFNHPSQGNSTNYYFILGPRDKAAPPTSQQIKNSLQSEWRT